MDRIVRESERHLTEQPERRRRQQAKQLADAVAEAAVMAASELAATALVAFTRSGFTARLIAKHRPTTPLVAYTPDGAVLQQLPLYWGVTPRLAPILEDTDHLLAWADRDLLSARCARGPRQRAAATATP
jgi:pyruvate kinase